VVPVAVGISAPPFETQVVSRKWRGGEEQKKSPRGVRNTRDSSIDKHVSTADEGFLDESDTGIIEDPRAEVLIWRDNVNGVHDA
jgi:hypothetical protein